MKGETYQTVSGILAHAICDVNTLIRIVDPAAYAGICFIHSFVRCYMQSFQFFTPKKLNCSLPLRQSLHQRTLIAHTIFIIHIAECFHFAFAFLLAAKTDSIFFPLMCKLFTISFNALGCKFFSL